MSEEQQGLAELMSQESSEPEVIEDGQEETEGLQAKETVEQTEEEGLQEQVDESPDVLKARSNGWTSKEEWVAKGNDADDWVSAKRFNERGEMMGEIHRLRNSAKDFDKRLDNAKKFMEAQKEADLAKLKQEQRKAVELADTEEFDRIQGQIDELNKPEEDTPDVSADQSVIDDFNQNNPWIRTDDPKAVYAKTMFAQFNSQGFSAEESINKMNDLVNKHFPATNERRTQPSTTQPGKGRQNKTVERSLQWNDLTEEELSLRKNTPFFSSMSKKDFLQAVQDSRK